jgi:hypothetical protein
VEDQIIITTPVSSGSDSSVGVGATGGAAFNTAEVQFNSRYHYFQTIASPTPLQYSQFLTLTQTIKGVQRNSKELLETAVKCFKSIKDLSERAVEVVEMNQRPENLLLHSAAALQREKLELQMNSNLVKVFPFPFCLTPSFRSGCPP